jgi:hypothetical protein
LELRKEWAKKLFPRNQESLGSPNEAHTLFPFFKTSNFSKSAGSWVKDHEVILDAYESGKDTTNKILQMLLDKFNALGGAQAV